jgi:phage protein D
MINEPNPVSTSQQPRGMVYANGEMLKGLLSFQVDNNGYFQADTFTVTLALAEQSASRDFAWWAVQEKMEIELLAGFPDDPGSFSRDDLTSYLTGYVDDLEVDPLSGLIVLTGRDLTSELIDYKRTLTFVGELTASGVVERIAKERGLVPVVTPTKKPVGTYYQIFHQLIEADCTYWDLITKLAQIEEYQVYVKGRELHFEPRTEQDSDPYVLRWQPPTEDRGHPTFNATRMTFRRNLSIAKDLRVRVISFDQKNKRKVEQVAERKRVYNKATRKAVRFTGPIQEYVYTFPNLTSDQAQRRAQALLKELSEHEVNLFADMPADDVLTTRNIIKVEGTGTAFDQSYYPASVARTYGRDEGFRMTVHAKNQTPNTPT